MRLKKIVYVKYLHAPIQPQFYVKPLKFQKLSLLQRLMTFIKLIFLFLSNLFSFTFQKKIGKFRQGLNPLNQPINYWDMIIYLYIFHENSLLTLEIICLISTLARSFQFV